MVDTAPPTSSRLTVLLAPSPGGPDTWQNTVRTLLIPQGVNLLFAHTGREALELLETHTVHVAVLDHRMPQLGGLQVLKLAREHRTAHPSHSPRESSPPSATSAQCPPPAPPPFTSNFSPAAILLADTLSTPLLHEALSMSVFTVLAKPVNHEQLLDALARAMRRFHNSQWPTTPARPVH